MYNFSLIVAGVLRALIIPLVLTWRCFVWSVREAAKLARHPRGQARDNTYRFAVWRYWVKAKTRTYYARANLYRRHRDLVFAVEDSRKRVDDMRYEIDDQWRHVNRSGEVSGVQMRDLDARLGVLEAILNAEAEAELEDELQLRLQQGGVLDDQELEALGIDLDPDAPRSPGEMIRRNGQTLTEVPIPAREVLKSPA